MSELGEWCALLLHTMGGGGQGSVSELSITIC